MATAPNRLTHPAKVVSVTDLTPHMRRIRVAGGALRTMTVDLPGQWMKVFFPAAPGSKAHGRAYTIRHHDAGDGTMDLDFVLHGDDGLASRWAGQAQVGETLMLAGPREGYAIDPASAHQVLIGDSTSLPAIAAILEVLPEAVTAHVFLELTDAAETALVPTRAASDLQVFISGTQAAGSTGQLERAIRETRLPPAPQVWVAGEALMVRAVRTLMVERGIDRNAVSASGYWRIGIEDHRDASLA